MGEEERLLRRRSTRGIPTSKRSGGSSSGEQRTLGGISAGGFDRDGHFIITYRAPEETVFIDIWSRPLAGAAEAIEGSPELWDLTVDSLTHHTAEFMEQVRGAIGRAITTIEADNRRR